VRKTLIALLFAASLPAIAMAAPPEGGMGHGGPGMHGHSPYSELNLALSANAATSTAEKHAG